MINYNFGVHNTIVLSFVIPGGKTLINIKTSCSMYFIQHYLIMHPFVFLTEIRDLKVLQTSVDSQPYLTMPALSFPLITCQ